MSDYKIKDNFKQHVFVKTTNTKGETFTELVVGTREQIVKAVTAKLDSNLTYGGTQEIVIHPIHPINISDLDKRS